MKSKHSRVFDRVLHVRLNMCLHYHRQQFPFVLCIVSTKSLLISRAQFFATLRLVASVRCLLVAVTKIQDKFANLRQVNSSNSQDKFQICCPDMFLVEFLANFAVFRVFLSISRDFADIPEFRGSATARNFRSPE